jgi:hypothetical protein
MKKFIAFIVYVFCAVGYAVDEPSPSVAEPNTPSAKPVVTESNIMELVSFEAVGTIELTPAPDILLPKYHLLPLKIELIDGAPLPVYREIFHKDPNHTELNPDFEFIEQQLAKPADRMDINAVKDELDRCSAKLELLKKASLCKTIQWPVMKYVPKENPFGPMYMLAEFGQGQMQSQQSEAGDEQVVFTAAEYLDFLIDIQQYGKLIALNARYQIVQREYDTAAEWIRIGLNISRQMIRNSNTQLGVMAAANAAVILQQVELWVQTQGSPSLYPSLQDLPMPFLNAGDLETLVSREPPRRRPGGRIGGGMPGFEMPLSDSNEEKEQQIVPDYTSEQFTQVSRGIDRFIAVLECLEGLRYYAGMYDGKLPNTLGEVTEIRLPIDPVTNNGFIYCRESDAFILQTADTRKAPAFQSFRYTIRMIPVSKD